MKILKIFGIVVGIHVFALVLIFANPGCSSTTQPPPVPTDTVAKSDVPPPVSVPLSAPAPAAPSASSGAAAPLVNFNPDAPAVGGTSMVSGSRYVPTRPGTPVVGALVAEPVVDVTPATTYTVKSGDNLWSIAKRNHLTAAELAAANGLPVSVVLQPNQKLMIPGKPASASAAATAKGGASPTPKATAATPTAVASRPTGEGIKHTVKSGETLGTIARIYGVKQGDIAVANNISDPAKIKAGTELLIPGWQAPGSKSGKTKAGGPKAGEPKVEQSPATPPPAVPVIPIYDSPITPAPKN